MKPELTIREKRLNELRMQIELLNLQLEELCIAEEYHEKLLYEEE